MMKVSLEHRILVKELIDVATEETLDSQRIQQARHTLEQAFADLEANQIPEGAIAVDVERLRELMGDTFHNYELFDHVTCRKCPAKDECKCTGDCVQAKIRWLIATLTAEQGTAESEGQG
jgi:hypothetical protein